MARGAKRKSGNTVRPGFRASLLVALWACGGPQDGAATAGTAPERQPGPWPEAPALAGLDGAARMTALGCGACHAGAGPPPPAPRLADGAGPRDPATLFAYLADSLPTRPRADGARMPDFHLSDAEALALARYLGSGRPAGAGRDAFEGARDRFESVTPADGARLYEAFRCGACHGGGAPPDAPVLANVAARVREPWLRTFLRRPHAVRPFGARPGSGARMPDFGLADGDVEAIAGTLLSGDTALAPLAADTLTPFGERKVATLLRERYDCLGCHAWNGEGGRIAPDLAGAAARLRPGYIRAMLDDPARLAPGTIMPEPRLTDADRDALASFIATSAPTASGTGYLSPLDHPTLPTEAPATADAAVYRERCAVCHGAGGGGDGFNARYLDTTPTAHGDAEAMRARPDDTLHDGIAAGGRILGKSARMPAFGASLDAAEIRGLVGYIRDLCDCAPPAWSQDGGR